MPGAEKSGLSRLSSVGPLEEKVAIPDMLFDAHAGHEPVALDRKFSLAPIEMTFFAVAGEPILSKSISPSPSPSVPSLAAANMMTRLSCSSALMSDCIDLAV